jgi:hypothetical protein
MLRLGLIGLDSTHAAAFTQLIHHAPLVTGFPRAQVVATLRGGSADFPKSATRIDEITRQVVASVGRPPCASIADLLPEVDAVMILSCDGRRHLAEARPVIAARKPLFIDKPLASNYADAAEIVRLAQSVGVPVFSASALRFSPEIIALRQKYSATLRTASASGPWQPEPFHPLLSWSGIHLVESLYTVLGPGCHTVTCERFGRGIVATGTWADGRTGLLRGGVNVGGEFTVTVPSPTGPASACGFSYAALVVEILRFFTSGQAPVAPAETLEILAFIDAAELSAARGGVPVALEEVTADTLPLPG